MNYNKFFSADKARLMAGLAFLAALTFGATQGFGQNDREPARDGVQVQVTTGAVQDDYDYYPAYETYYNRSSHQYVYHDGNSWVRRSEPNGVTADTFHAAPSVHMDFHDAPELHHSTVSKTYPKTWVKPGESHDDKGDGRK